MGKKKKERKKKGKEKKEFSNSKILVLIRGRNVKSRRVPIPGPNLKRDVVS